MICIISLTNKSNRISKSVSSLIYLFLLFFFIFSSFYSLNLYCKHIANGKRSNLLESLAARFPIGIALMAENRFESEIQSCHKKSPQQHDHILIL